MAAADAPLGPAEFAVLFADLADATGIVAAVSGGPDSTALMYALAQWRPEGGRPPVTVATVDHGLRPESAGEAAAVATAAERLGLDHRRLVWTGAKPATGWQEAARDARYRLLAGLAHDIGASHLVTAHTLDDQAETMLMRLAHGSGLAGLAGMRVRSRRDGRVHLRPFLGIAKARLVAACRANEWPFVEDPSNRDPRFARARWRALAPALAAEGLTAERLGRLALRVQRAEDALETEAWAALERARIGESTYAAAAFAAPPPEIAGRMLRLALAPHLRSADAGRLWRLRRFEDCTEALRRAAAAACPLRRTLAGCLLTVDSVGNLTIGPEPERRRGRRQREANDDAAGPPHSLGKGGTRA